MSFYDLPLTPYRSFGLSFNVYIKRDRVNPQRSRSPWTETAREAKDVTKASIIAATGPAMMPGGFHYFGRLAREPGRARLHSNSAGTEED